MTRMKGPQRSVGGFKTRMVQGPFQPLMITLFLIVPAMVSQSGDAEGVFRPLKTLEVRTRGCTTPILHTTKLLVILSTSLEHRNLHVIPSMFIQGTGSIILHPL